MTRQLKFFAPILIAGLALFAVAGCRSTGSGMSSPKVRDERLAEARRLYDRGQYNKAMLACIDIGRASPEHPGLGDLQRDISQALWEQRATASRLRQETTDIAMHADMAMRKQIPITYGLRRGVMGDFGPMRTEPTEMERTLQDRPITMHVDSIDLSQFILDLGQNEKINIIADVTAAPDGEAKTMSLHVDQVPLREVLDYVSRNLGVAFSVGRNMIWATTMDSTEPRLPMETRLYRLRKGLSSMEIQGGPNSLGIIEAVSRFVPEEEGADLFFNDKSHVLIARNTRDNLFRIEELIEALDISPPQVLIEARFIQSTVTDLRELGIDWVLNSAVGITKRNVLRNGSVASVNSTEIASGAGIGISSFTSESTGLNLTYQGLLTDPMFQAVLHALETSGKSRTLSVPKVTTVNNRPARIRVGKDLLYFEEYESRSESVNTGRTTDSGVPIYETRYTTTPRGRPTREETGIELSVTPSVGSDMRSIGLYMVPKFTSLAGWFDAEIGGVRGADTTTSNTNDAPARIVLPIFNVSEIETEVVVGSGETVVMGGLIESTENMKEERVPILSSIPLIGSLFRYHSSTVDDQNLLIFVTATIISERGEHLVPILPGDVPADYPLTPNP